MSEENLVQLRLHKGRYEGMMSAPETPEVEVLHAGAVIAMAAVSPDADRAGSYRVSVDIPAQVLSEGVQVVSFRSRASGDILDRVTFMSGAVLDDDIRGEMALMREELEILKRAFRHHCAETKQG